MTVVAGVDESPISRNVVEAAVEQAKWRDTDLHLVHVGYYPIVYSEVPIDWGEVAEAQRQHVWGQLESVIPSEGVHVERVDLEGYPPDTLVDYANEQPAELLVVGTRGRGDFASLVLGSTSHRTIHLSICDVLVVKAPEGQ
ncbi:MAG TPA: universal stress protein [Acidimicrobiia bacterium]|nr:universal stress protein [Acidimicrobiia bacterium]